MQKVTILKLLTEIDNGGTTYSIQLHFENFEAYQNYETNFKDYILDRHDSLFRGKFVTFSTLLQEV
jgi:hypothetical protein